MRFDSLDAWLRWQEGLHPKAIDLGLERVREVADRLGILSPSATVITVAGTNGKGSSLAMLDAIYRQAGYRVGLYTSPHIHHYSERIRIQGKMVDDAGLCVAFEAIDQARGDISLSYFEFGTLAALWLFSQEVLDLILLEVGLGGRLDAVNIVDADVALITTIDIDHIEWLGNDREQIGVEKAGIMRRGSPVIVSDAMPPDSILQEAARLKSHLFRLGHDFQYRKKDQGWSWQMQQTRYDDLPLPALQGEFQLQNAAGVLAVVGVLRSNLPVTRKAIVDGLRGVRCAGRMTRIGVEPEMILDVAHNPQSTAALAEYMSDNPVSGRSLAVLGVMRDKDLAGMLAPLLDCFDAWYLASPKIPRAMEVAALSEQLQELGGRQIVQFNSVADACEAALSAAKDDDRIVVFGSFYTVAEAMPETL
jgi:dihydrofolate synthase / folylpolyglutamate synthase